MNIKEGKMVAHSLAGVVILLLLATSVAQAVPREQPPNVITISGSPLRMEVGSNLSLQLYHQKYEDSAAYGTADSGPFWFIDGETYGPHMPSYAARTVSETSVRGAEMSAKTPRG